MPNELQFSQWDETNNGKITNHMVIDWPEVRKFLSDGFNGETTLKRAANRWRIFDLLAVKRPWFTGYSREQVIDWLQNGYESDALKNVDEFTPPVREKRRFIYDEEGDEIDLSAAWSGEDNFITRWTKREVIPGVKLEFAIGFVVDTSAKVVNEYMVWIAQAVTAIMQAGIDPEVNVIFRGSNEWDDYNKFHRIVVRVKREGEATDFQDWSAMLSPAGFRTFGFALRVLLAETLQKNVHRSRIGGSIFANWQVKYNAESGTIRVECDSGTPSYFPAEDMTAQLRKAIENLKFNISD